MRAVTISNANDVVTSAVASMPRPVATSNAISTGNQNLRLAYFVTPQSFTINNLTVAVGATAAGATPTLIRMGVYTIDGSNNLTLAASTTNDTTLLTGASGTEYTKALNTPVALVAGTRYAYGFLIVTAATAPTVFGYSGLTTELARAPRLAGFVGSQSDLPSTVTAGSVSATSAVPYMVGT